MKKNFTPISAPCLKMIKLGLILLFATQYGIAQQLPISDFVVFGGNSSCAGCSVVLESSTKIQGGSVGSYRLIQSTGSATINANIYSGGTVKLASSNTVFGKISAANKPTVTGSIISIGSYANLNGNIDGNGNIAVTSGSVKGKVTRPAGFTYSGPVPTGGSVAGTPSLPMLPQMPAITNFPAYNSNHITNTRAISPGEYGDVVLTGGKTLTLNGPGVYVFKSIKNSGSTNNFVFNFNNNATGVFKIYIHDDVNLNRVKASMINGGNASRIYSETHGNGGSCSDGNYAWEIDNGSSSLSSAWLGTIWAPYGGIEIESCNNNTEITGALLSATQVKLESGVTVNYAPFIECSIPQANAGPDQELSCTITSVSLSGSSSSSSVSFSWAPLGNGNIVSGANTLTPVVDKAGSYILTVSSTNGGCLARDTMVVKYIPCVLPYYPPPVNGKVNVLIGAELSSLYENFGNVVDSAKDIFNITSDSVYIEVISRLGQYATLSALLKTTPYGMTDTIDNGPGSLIISGKYPIKNLRKLDSLPLLIDYCRPLFPALGNSGVVKSRGDTAMQAYFVRNGYDLTGDSVRIGVLSDSYNTQPGNPALVNVLNDDLPGVGNATHPYPVNVLKEFPYGQRLDEGRAMLQIIHDVAPAAKLSFRTGFISAGDFAQGILQLQKDTCDIIVDDITFITEPFFTDGVVARAVDSVAKKGVSYFSAAGNFGSQSYESVFNAVAAPSGISGSAHNFGGGDVLQNITLTPGTYTVVLQWEDEIYSLGGSANGTQNDLDIYLTDISGNALFGFNRNNTGGDPIEILPFSVTVPTQTNILVTRASGSGNVRFKYVFFRGNGVVSEYNSGNGTIVGQANAAGAMAVGAALYSNTPVYGVNPPTVASFSSRGGTNIGGVVRNKPDFVAPNGGNTTVNLGGPDIDGDIFPNFFGTSAAAPHAAGVAALLIQGKRKFGNATGIGPDSMRLLLQQSAIDMGVPGFDFATGSGLVQANRAMRSFAAPKPEIKEILLADPGLTPGSQQVIVTVDGNYLDSSSKITFRGEPLPTTIINGNQLSATIPPFFGNPAIQVYTQPVSASGTDGGYSNSLYFFAPVKKNVVVSADTLHKKYGEQIPSFTARIMVDGLPVDSSGLTLAELGLDTIAFACAANAGSNVGIYNIIPSLKQYEPTDSFYIGLLESYNYTFNNSVLAIEKMPLTITARDTVLQYGDKLSSFAYNYIFEDSAIAETDRTAFLNNLTSSYFSNFADNAVALVDSRALANGGRTLTSSDLEELTF